MCLKHTRTYSRNPHTTQSDTHTLTRTSMNTSACAHTHCSDRISRTSLKRIHENVANQRFSKQRFLTSEQVNPLFWTYNEIGPLETKRHGSVRSLFFPNNPHCTHTCRQVAQILTSSCGLGHMNIYVLLTKTGSTWSSDKLVGCTLPNVPTATKLLR